MRDVQYRKEFIKAFGELFTADGAIAHGEGAGVDHMEYDADREVVTVFFNGGGKKDVNVAMDSLAAMAYDVARYALF